MRLIRFLADGGEPLTGVLDGDITTLAAVPGLGGLLARPLSRIREICAAPGGETVTSLVPDLPFTLEAGDEIAITIPPLGELINPVVRGKAAVSAGKNAAQKPGSDLMPGPPLPAS